jgi:hypothetical protein
LSSGTRIFNIRGPPLYCKFMGISTPMSALILCSSINQSSLSIQSISPFDSVALIGQFPSTP